MIWQATLAAVAAVFGSAQVPPDVLKNEGAAPLVQLIVHEDFHVDPDPPPAPPVQVRTRTEDRGPTRSGEPPEYLLVGSAGEVSRAEDEIAAINGAVLRRRDLPGLGLSMTAVDLGPIMAPPVLRARLERRGIGVALDRNTVYAPAGPGRSYMREMVGLSGAGECRLRRPVRVGIIDGPVDLASAGRAGVSVVTRSMLDADEVPADPDHATGLVMLIAAGEGDGPAAGVAPGARIFAAVASARAGSRAEMRLDHIVSALDWLVSERVELVNLSLAGPRNHVLATAIEATDARGIVLVAAAGNDGRGDVAFPAADPHVISVTAVDARKRRFRSANTGREIDFAAPGVDVLIPGLGEATYRSGTSYAAAVVSGLVARELARGAAGGGSVMNTLAARAEDLGDPGRDSAFGWGLVRDGGC